MRTKTRVGWISAATVLLLLGLLVYTGIYRFSHVDMTETQLLLKLWPIWPLMAICGVVIILCTDQ
jgi:hypothetical protein